MIWHLLPVLPDPRTCLDPRCFEGRTVLGLLNSTAAVFGCEACRLCQSAELDRQASLQAKTLADFRRWKTHFHRFNPIELCLGLRRDSRCHCIWN